MSEQFDIRGGDEQAVAKAVTRAAEAIASGQLVAVPDEAGYQLVASICDPEATERLLQAPLRREPVVLGNDADSLLQWVSDPAGPGELTLRLARRCWPAPVVLELNPQETAPGGWSPAFWEGVGERQRLGVRVPAHEVPRGLLDLADSPLLARPLPVTDAGEVVDQSIESASVILQAGPSRYAGGDTTIRVDGQDWEVTHEGAVGAATVARMACRVVVFVCTGNTCRSPMAEALFRKLAAQRLQCPDEELVDRGLLVGSAGVGTYGGSSISPEAAESLRERGIESASHVSQPLTAELAVQADYLVTMTRGHRDSILNTWPDAEPRVRLLDPNGTDIDDPIGGSPDIYAACCRTIETHLGTLIDELFAPQS
jgi:protein-tyrosine-phosphatase/tRNA A37 threonylcarbamoyladenosine synthetase subunit TsaC/SUA5/YrdC